MNAWQQLDARQRRLIALAVGVLFAALIYVWVWEPLSQTREAEREHIAQQQALLNWLDAVAPLAQRLRSSDQASREPSDRSLLGLADETARAAGLAGAMARIEPVGDREVRVWLEGADFVAVMGWLEDFSRSQAIRVGQLQVDRAGTKGQVNVRVTLSGNA